MPLIQSETKRRKLSRIGSVGNASRVNPSALVSRQAINALLAVDWDFKDAETDYLTHGLHPYPAKFIPQIPRGLIRELSKPGDTVADVFCGSGTTLVEALLHGCNAVGVDANPLACLISAAKTTRPNSRDLKALKDFASKIESLLLTDEAQASLFYPRNVQLDLDVRAAEAIHFWFDPHVIEELATIRSAIEDLPELPKRIAQVCLSSIIVGVSKQDSDTRYVRRNKVIRRGETIRRFLRAFRSAIAAVTEFAGLVDTSLSCRAIHADVLDRPDIGKVDLVVSSPPYPNAYSYHLYHMTRMLWLGMDQGTFKKREIGSHRKYSRNGPNGATAETFQAELITIFNWLSEQVNPGGYICFVIGDSIIKGRKIRNDELMVYAAKQNGLSVEARIDRRLQEEKKAFNPKIGRIKEEHVIILQKGP